MDAAAPPAELIEPEPELIEPEPELSMDAAAPQALELLLLLLLRHWGYMSGATQAFEPTAGSRMA